NDGELLLPGSEQGKAPRVGYIARTAVQEQQHRVGRAAAAYRDPLLDAAERHEARLIDTWRYFDCKARRVRRPQRDDESVEPAIFVIQACHRRRIPRGDGDACARKSG